LGESAQPCSQKKRGVARHGAGGGAAGGGCREVTGRAGPQVREGKTKRTAREKNNRIEEEAKSDGKRERNRNVETP